MDDDYWVRLYEQFTGEKLPVELMFGNHTMKQEIELFQQERFHPNHITGYLTVLWEDTAYFPDRSCLSVLNMNTAPKYSTKRDIPSLSQIYFNMTHDELPTDEFGITGPAVAPWGNAQLVKCSLILKLHPRYMRVRPKGGKVTHIRLENVIVVAQDQHAYIMRCVEGSTFITLNEETQCIL